MQGQESQRPNLSDLRESGAIEQDADVVVMLHRAMDRENRLMTAEVWAIVQKNRNGPIGDCRLSFFPAEFRFETFTPEGKEGRPVLSADSGTQRKVEA
jgi:replicative DNA helicase